MSFMTALTFDHSTARSRSFSKGGVPRRTRLVIVSDDPALSQTLDVVCDFLDVPVEHVSSEDDIAATLRRERPMAIIVDVDGSGRDGYDVMMTVSEYDGDLPLMLLTEGVPELLGAADAIQELWGLTNVVTPGPNLAVAEIVDFVLMSGRSAGLNRVLTR